MNPTVDIGIRKKQKKPKDKKQKKPKKVKALPEYCLPSPDSVRSTIVIIGSATRMLLAGLLSAAFAGFFFDSFGLRVLNAGVIYAIAVVLVLIFALMCRGTKWYWGGFGATALLLLLSTLISGNPVALVLGMFPAAWNTAMGVLARAGYRAFPQLSIPMQGLSNEVLVSGFQIFLLLSITILVFCSVYRKVRMLPLFICGVFTMLPVFTYNFVTSNGDFAVIVVAVSGIMALRVYDRALVKERSMAHKSAVGGFMGLGAALLACVAVLIPAVTMKTAWAPIKGISEPMEVARNILSAVLIGETPDWSGIDNLGNVDSLGSRTTNADHRNYKGKEILEVYAGISVPVYLRSWIAVDFDDDTWRTASEAERLTYYAAFPEDFSAEQLTQFFYDSVAPEIQDFDLSKQYQDHTEYGFVTTLISLNVLRSGGNLLYVPARFDIERGFLGYEGNDEKAGKPYDAKVNYYYDGLYTTSWTNRNKQYSTVAFLPTYRDTTFSQKIDAAQEQFLANVAVIEAYHQVAKNSNYSADAFFKRNEELFSDSFDYSMFYSFASMNYRERKEYYQTHIESLKDYQTYVSEQYSKKLKSSRVKNLANQIMNQKILPQIGVEEWDASLAGDAKNIHTAVMAVVNYLKATCTYTLTPKQNDNPIISRGYNSVETFLFLTKEGYCVQYATAAAFILREYGIPVRYVEGYMVEELEYDRDSTNRFAHYKQTVRDYNAHAWIEVWYDGIGWLPYEATEPYYDQMYKPYGQSQKPGTIFPAPIEPSTPPETMEPIETTDQVITPPIPPLPVLGIMTLEQAMLLGAALLGCLILLVVILLIRHAVKKKKARIAARQQRVERALNDVSLTQAEIDALSVEMQQLIAGTCSVNGMERHSNEYASAYAQRIDNALAGLKNPPVIRYRFEQIVPILEKTAFGRHMAREELVMLAEFWISLRDKTCERFNAFEKFWYGTVKEMV